MERRRNGGETEEKRRDRNGGTEPVPVFPCGERVVDIIYGTGDMTEIEFLLEYRREGIMGGDNIPRRQAELIKFVRGG